MNLRYWQRRILVTAWIAYASYYLGRVNISMVLPYAQMEFGWTKTQIGLIGSALFWVYAFGQLINGQLGDRLGARNLVALGMLASAAMNVALGLSSTLTAMIVLCGLNGYFQATGWGPIVKTLANWFSPRKRGRLSAVFAPCFVFGHTVAWLLAGWLAAKAGWRTALWVPAALLSLSALNWWTRIRNSPQSAGLSEIEGRGPLSTEEAAPLVHTEKRLGARYTLWVVAGACLFHGIAKDGFSLWAPTFLLEARDLRSPYLAVVMPLCGMVGIALAGWATDRFFKSREPPVVTLMLLTLAVLIGAYSFLLPTASPFAHLLALGVIGATAYGANAIMLTTVPLGLGASVSSAAGFLDFASYIGAGLSGLLTGALLDRWHWNAVFGFWALAALTGGALMGLLWRGERRR